MSVLSLISFNNNAPPPDMLQVTTTDSGSRHLLSPPRIRRLVSEYIPHHTPGYANYNPFPNASTSALPRYIDEDVPVKLPPPRFKVAPREEEGREELPAYSCSLHHEGVFERKMELKTPFERADRRRWRKFYFVLRGTKLDVHQARSTPWFQKGSLKINSEVGYVPGKLVESYTLQLAEVGTAADYKKRSYVIRLRLQDQQFLIAFDSQRHHLEWLDALSSAIDLSPSLEERALPQHRTLPRRRRRPRPRPTDPNPNPDPDPNLNPDPNPDTQQDTVADLDADCAPPEAITAAEVISQMEFTAVDAATRRALRVIPEETFDEDGKWAPRLRYTNEDNLQYAKRCMAVLCADAPRQNNFIVVKGKLCRLEWETREMVPAEEVGDDKGAGWGLCGKEKADTTKGVKSVRLPEYEEVVQGVAGERRSAAF